MINSTKYELLYDQLFAMAWNSDYVNPQKKQYINAFKFAIEILNNYHLRISRDLTAKRILLYKNTKIRIVKGRKLYECENNSKHKIKIGNHYAMILEGNTPVSDERLCLSCAAKILLPIITNFPPSDKEITYTVKNIDWDVFE